MDKDKGKTENRKSAGKGGVTVKGFRASAISVGIKKSRNKDLSLIVSEADCTVAGVFTKNLVRAAPVVLCEKRLKSLAGSGSARGVVINSGIANVCTGKPGWEAALRTAASVEKELGFKRGSMFVASTGLIGGPLPVEKIEKGVGKLAGELSRRGFEEAAAGIMTTDTFPKIASKRIRLGTGKDVKTVTIAGIAKGAGMIAPDMATMLAFFMTDADIKQPLLQAALREAVDVSFNSIAVDNDTSTNDTVLVFANALSSAGEIKKGSTEYELFLGALTELSVKLAKMIVEDGEGATKFVELYIKGAGSKADALKAARTLATSMLVKTAFFGEDPNWGRFMGALGRAGIRLKPGKVCMTIGGVPVIKDGLDAGGQARARRALKSKNIKVVVDLNIGRHDRRFWTTDLSYGYVKENSQYST